MNLIQNAKALKNPGILKKNINERQTKQRQRKT